MNGKSSCLALAMMLAAVSGCSPPPPASTPDDLAVEMPGSHGNGSGAAIQASIDPPYLTDIPDERGASAARGDADGQADADGQGDADGQTGTASDANEPSDRIADASAPDASAPDAGARDADTPSESVPASDYDPEAWRRWQTPDVTLVVTGDQHGYIEPCGCTGLDRQKGGIARRFTFMKQLRDKGWSLLPIDAGNQVRRFGRQAEVKLQQSVKAMSMMDYRAIGFGPEDLRLGVGELLAVAAGDGPDDTMFVSGNVVLIDPSLMPQVKVIEMNGLRIGITSILDPDSLEGRLSDDITVAPKEESAKNALEQIKQGSPTFGVLMFYGTEEAGKQLMRSVPGYELIVVAGGYGEPTYQPQTIEGSKTRMVVTGNKGMYAGLVGLYKEAPLQYARVPLTHEFEDAPEMRQIMKEYQDQLRDIGLQGLGLLPPIPHSSGQKFVGTATCAECHTSAFDVWEGTPHALATDHIVEPPEERGDVPRHFDPECVSCHVTGWNPQEYYPYLSGYLSLESSEHLTGSGCENCHGPGSDHVAAETGEVDVSDEQRDQWREAMRLPLEKAREKCMTCHDLDNSPDFHEDGAFEDVYWPEVEHYGME